MKEGKGLSASVVHNGLGYIYSSNSNFQISSVCFQIDMGEVNSERSRGSGSSGPSAAHTHQAFSKFYPARYREDLAEEDSK